MTKHSFLYMSHGDDDS